MSHTNGPVHIVTGADDNFAMPLGVTLYSILKNVNIDTELTFHILDGGIEKENGKKIYGIVNDGKWNGNHNIEWINPDTASVDNLPKHDWMSEATYLRLLLPEILPSHLKKVIYLDCDLILETDIAELWHQNIDDVVIGAAIDIYVQTLSHRTGVSDYEDLGGQADSPYFNSGVMLINMDKWRRENVTEKAIEYLKTHKDSFTLHEQEALNAAVIGKWKELDPRWNQQASSFWLEILPDSEFTESLKEMGMELLHKPYIIHYISKSKPWDYKCMHPSTHRFLFYLKESGWFSRSEWLIWWYRFYYRRFMWLFSDLKQTLRQVKIRENVPERRNSGGTVSAKEIKTDDSPEVISV